MANTLARFKGWPDLPGLLAQDDIPQALELEQAFYPTQDIHIIIQNQDRTSLMHHDILRQDPWQDGIRTSTEVPPPMEDCKFYGAAKFTDYAQGNRHAKPRAAPLTLWL
jgi:hypothetical protein